VQPVVELVGGEEAALIEEFADGGKTAGSHGIAGTITAKHQQAARTGVRNTNCVGWADSDQKGDVHHC
jgi:hypothetical protein